jgi:AcrR family transcriptional regulator
MPDLLSSAEMLFQQQGYSETTMRQIATSASIPLEQLERDYPSKEHLALAIYQRLSQQSFETVASIAEGSISERYFRFLEQRIPTLNPHTETASALFAYAMLPKSPISPAMISPTRRDPILKAMQSIVEGAEDKPSDEEDADNLALLLYSFHFLVMIFWLYDRTENKQASQFFISFLRDFVKLTRPMMIMPMINKALHKMTQITLLVFGGAKLSEKP